jgi:FtsP/CotA-like multicopper oxidase with cupredoxin domain
MGKKNIDRRDFLKLTSVGLAGGLLTLKGANAFAGMMGGGGMGGGGMGGGGMGGGGGGMGGGGVIDPPPGAAFRDPMTMPVARSVETINGISRNVATVNLQAVNARVPVNGVTANLMTYNGYYPGPTIKVNRGDILRVNFTNALSGPYNLNLLGHQRGPTNLHAHGWHVSPNAISLSPPPPVYSDYVMYSMDPGDSCIHEYDTSKEEASGFHFYHPHLHGISAEQYWAGLAGALITADELPVFNGIETHLMVLKDISLSGSDPAPHDTMMDYMHGLEGNIVMVNGQVNPVLPIFPGQVQRWRILNASNARWYKLSLTNHTMYLVGTDGNLLDKPYARSQILLSPGERVDILVKGGAVGDYKFLSLPYSRMGNMTSAQITLLTMHVTGNSAGGVLPASINPNVKRLNLNVSMYPQRTLQLSMGGGAGYINGISFTGMDHTFKISSTVGTDMMPSYEVWTVTNASGMDHPFHQHVDHAQVLSVTGADSSYPSYASMPAWKDVVLIPKMGSAKLLVPVKDYDGMTMFHCHILEHEDIGMMGVWDRMAMAM